MWEWLEKLDTAQSGATDKKPFSAVSFSAVSFSALGEGTEGNPADSQERNPAA